MSDFLPAMQHQRSLDDEDLPPSTTASTTRSSLDQLLSRTYSFNSATTTIKRNTQSSLSQSGDSELSDTINFDDEDSIAPLVLALSFPHLKNNKTLSGEARFLMLIACCLGLISSYESSCYLVISLGWLGLTVSSIFLWVDQARLLCLLGQCGVVLSAGSIVLSSSISSTTFSFIPRLLPTLSSTLGSSSMFEGLVATITELGSNGFYIIDTPSTALPSGTMDFTWSWSHGALWICCVGLFHMAQRLCDIQDHENSVAEQQQSIAQRQVDQYLGKVAIIRERFVDTLAREIQEATLMVMTTLEQFAPITILNNTHELLSPCSMPVPVTSISAINTTVNEVGHIGSHLHLVSRLLRQEQTCVSPECRDFDIGELIQTVGDAIGAMASKIDVSIILYHMDNGLHCINVLGDEDAIKHGILCLLRNIMEGCTPGAYIEIGLNAESHGSDRLQITFEITQTRSHAIPHGVPISELSLSVYTTELLRYSGGTLSVNKLNEASTRYLVLYNMQAGSDNAKRRLIMERSIHDLRNNVQYASEPTLLELIDFVGKLKGMRMILYATEKSIFAKHLTSCLASWNVDISHMPTTAPITITTPSSFYNLPVNSPILPGNPSSVNSASSTSTTASNATSHKAPTPATEEDHIHSIPPAFLLIDNDLPTLERQLQDFRIQQQQYYQQQQQQQQLNTPTTPSYFAPALTGQQEGSGAMTTKRHRRQQQRTIAIIYFSYLKDYRKTREVVLQYSSTSAYPARVFIVPKPCGPRRFLTALHTAWLDAIVDPQFAPMATSPLNNPHQRPTTPNSAHTPPTPNTITIDSKRISPAPRSEDGLGNYFSPRHASNSISNTGGASNKSASASASAASNNRSPSINRRLRSPSTTFHPPNGNNSRRMVDLSFSSLGPDQSSTPEAIDGEVNDGGSLKISTGSPLSASHISDNEAITEHQLPSNATHDLNSIPSQSPVMSPPASGPMNPALDDLIQPSEQQLGNIKKITSPPLPVAGPSVMEHPVITSLDEASASSNAPTSASSATPPAAAPKRNLKFKISNRKKKDKNKHTPWWSPPIKVLIVEDNMINQAILSTWMKKHDIKYEVSSDGKQAVEKWKKGGFHLILMDIQLPVMSGIDATKMIRQIEKEKNIGVLPSKWDNSKVMTNEDKDNGDNTSSLPSSSPESLTASTLNDNDNGNNKDKTASQRSSPTKSSSTTTSNTTTFQSPVIIVALTASSHESDRQAALSAGCNDFLTKPVSLEWLEKKIMEWGCMQALIDVEGWRQWKRTAPSGKSSSLTTSSAAAKTTTLDKTLAILKSTKKGSATPSSPTSPVSQTLPSVMTTRPSILPDQDQQLHDGPSLSASSSSSSLFNKTHGILLQGSSTSANKRMTTKSRLTSREPVS
ncbi:hypothetical protein BC941DRAFT_465798 [Chlamydoabsidia padenii]|nr:hypothetical protein BC941DRAFT_465798 [Chlamydoabsidia padenii]